MIQKKNILLISNVIRKIYNGPSSKKKVNSQIKVWTVACMIWDIPPMVWCAYEKQTLLGNIEIFIGKRKKVRFYLHSSITK